MIDILMDLVGYSGSDPIVTYIVVMAALVLTICLAYKFLDFVMSLITSIVGRDKDIKF